MLGTVASTGMSSATGEVVGSDFFVDTATGTNDVPIRGPTGFTFDDEFTKVLPDCDRG